MADQPGSAVAVTDQPVVIPATQELTPQPPVEQTAAQRQRDAQGRFAGQAVSSDAAAPVVTPASAPQPKFAQNLMELARSVYYTDDQIAKFDDPALLFDAIRGRAATMQREAPPAAQPVPRGYGADQNQNMYAPSSSVAAPPLPVAASPFEPLKLELSDDEVAPELAKHLRAMEAYTNKSIQKLDQENQALRQQLAQTQGAVQQSAVSAQQISVQQQSVFWDQIAATVPGMVEEMGKPSLAMMQPGSPQAKAWAEAAPHIAIRAQAQQMPEQYIDYPRAAREGYVMYQALKHSKNNGSGQPRDSDGLPGVALHSAPRQSTAPVSKQNMTPHEDYDARMAAMQAAFQQAGGKFLQEFPVVGAFSGVEEFFYLFGDACAHTGEAAKFPPGAEGGDFFGEVGEGVGGLLIGADFEGILPFYLKQAGDLGENFRNLAIAHRELLGGGPGLLSRSSRLRLFIFLSR